MMEGDFCEESPFENSVSLSKLQMLQVFIMTLTIVPLRLLCCGVLMCITVFVAYVAGLVAPKDNDAPRSTLERVALDLCTQMILLAHLILGLRVTTLGTPAAAHQAPIWVMAPHTSFFDVLPCTTLRPTPSVVAKSEALRTPVLGVWLRLTRFIAVARDSEGARRDARLQLQQRAQLLATQRADGSWPQVLIFPEATCHNRKSLLQFYTGAFVPGVPVQPVCVHWPRDNCWMLFWLQLCKLWHPPVVVEFLPVYNPTEMERGNPALYAENVRKLMAKTLNVKLSPYSYSDVPYVCYNEKRPNLAYVHKLFDAVRDPYTAEENDLASIMQRAYSDDFLASRQFRLGRRDFSQFFNSDSKLSPNDEFIRKLFNVFDIGCKNEIDIREYLIVRYGGPPATEFFETAFTALAQTNDIDKASISVHEALMIIRLPCSLTVNMAEKLCTFAAGSTDTVLFGELMFALSKAHYKPEFYCAKSICAIED